MTTSISWLVMNDDDVQRAREVLRSLKHEGMLDELGFGPMQSAFADWFYPATNTIMTRPRYLYFVAAIYKHIEASRESRAPGKVARQLQDDLRRVLVASGMEGVFGTRAGADVKRLPSNVYWIALRELGFFRRRTFESAYVAELGDRSKRRHVDDDGRPLGSSDAPGWDPTLPLPEIGSDGQFPAGTDFTLRAREAADLLDRFERLESSEGARRSLLTWRTRHDARSKEDAHAWSGKTPADEDLANGLRHAERLSALARGAILAYHDLLRVGRESTPRPVEMHADLAACAARWWTSQRRKLVDWDLGDLEKLLWGLGHTRVREDMLFLTGLVDTLRTPTSGGDWLRSEAVAQAIARRERKTRPTKARLVHRTHLETWEPRRDYSSDYELHYRNGIGRRFVRDIVEALPRGAS